MARRLQDHTKKRYTTVFNGQETARSYKRSVIQLCFQWPGDCKIIQRNVKQLCFQWPGDCKIIQRNVIQLLSMARRLQDHTKKHYTTVFSMARRLQDHTKKRYTTVFFNGQETARSYKETLYNCVVNGHVLTAITNTQHVQVTRRLQDQTKKAIQLCFQWPCSNMK